MALGNLTLSFTERNDSTALILTDTTNSIVQSTNWGTDSNINYDDIDGITYNINIIITITTSDGTSTEYDQFSLYDEFGPFTEYSDLTYTITPDLLKEGGISPFTSDDVLPDGVYEITYIVTNAGEASADVKKEYSILLNGVVKTATYNLLRQIPNIYEFQGDVESRTVREAMFASSYLEGIENSDKEKALSQLQTLENIIRNGSNNPW